MKLLILGSGSFAGHLCYYHFQSIGFDVLGINRSLPKEVSFWPSKTNFGSANWIQAHIINDYNKILSAILDYCPDYILDFMGQGMVSQSWHDPSLWYTTNFIYKSRLLDAISKHLNLKLYIRAGTPEVFGNSELPMSPHSTFNPSTPYAVSHAAIDHHIRNLGRQYDFPYVLARYANFYGPGQQLYRVIPKSILSLMSGKEFFLDGGGTSSRSFIYATDIIASFQKMLEYAPPKSEFHFSSSEEITILNLVRLIARYVSVDFDQFVSVGPERRGKDMFYRLDCTSSMEQLGWSPSISLDTGINYTLDWISSNFSFLNQQSLSYLHSS